MGRFRVADALEEFALPYRIHRFKSFATLTDAEQEALIGMSDAEVVHKRGETLRREGEPTAGFLLLNKGWVTSSIVLRSGDRLVQKLHLPGDMLGTPSMVLERAADTLTAATEVVTAFVPYARFAALGMRMPRLALFFAMAVQMERLSLMDMLAVTGNASAREQLARLLLDLHARLSAIGAVEDDAFDLPVTQEVIGDLLGMTSVHVNRTIRQFEKDEIIAREGHRVRLLDPVALKRLSPLSPRRFAFEPAWLPAAD